MKPQLQGGALFTLSDADRFQASEEKYKRANAISSHWLLVQKQTIDFK